MRGHKFQCAAVLTAVQVFRATTAHSESQLCRYLPHDRGWPVLEEWKSLNASVSGRLIQTVPAANVCHDPTYNETLCAAIRESWIYPWGQYVSEVSWKHDTDPAYSFNDPSGFIAAYQQNASCDPFTPQETPCQQGNYVEYAIDVHEAADVVAGVQFALEKNIRLVVKNTGHEYVAFFGKRLPSH